MFNAMTLSNNKELSTQINEMELLNCISSDIQKSEMLIYYA